MWIKTYGRLYQNLCSTTCEIPIGLYRTDMIRKERNQPNNKNQMNKVIFKINNRILLSFKIIFT